MKPITRYKLTALGFFFVLFVGYLMQFIWPYHPVLRKMDEAGRHYTYLLADNLFVLPLALVAGCLLIYQFVLYPSVKEKVKFIPLLGAVLVLVLLVSVHFINRAENLDDITRQKVMELLNDPGRK